MQECPKCSTQYGDEVKICRTCGAILEAVAGEPPQKVEDNPSPHEDDGPHEATSAEEPSWKCPQCSQSVPGGFEVCWNCGTSKDGVPDSDFGKEPVTDDGVLRTWQPPEQAAAVKQIGYQCPKCGSSKIIPRRRIPDQGQYSNGKLQVIVDGDPDALIFKDRLYRQLIADICGECGHVELSVENPGELYEHYLRSNEESGD